MGYRETGKLGGAAYVRLAGNTAQRVTYALPSLRPDERYGSGPTLAFGEGNGPAKVLVVFHDKDDLRGLRDDITTLLGRKSRPANCDEGYTRGYEDGLRAARKLAGEAAVGIPHGSARLTELVERNKCVTEIQAHITTHAERRQGYSGNEIRQLDAARFRDDED